MFVKDVHRHNFYSRFESKVNKKYENHICIQIIYVALLKWGTEVERLESIENMFPKELQNNETEKELNKI